MPGKPCSSSGRGRSSLGVFRSRGEGLIELESSCMQTSLQRVHWGWEVGEEVMVGGEHSLASPVCSRILASSEVTIGNSLLSQTPLGLGLAL